MKYAILKDLKEISERRDTVKLGQLVESLNQAKDSDNTLLVERIFNNRYSIEIKDNHIKRYDGSKVSVVVIGADRNICLDDSSDVYVVCVFCRNNDTKYGFNHWNIADENGITYHDIDELNRLR